MNILFIRVVVKFIYFSISVLGYENDYKVSGSFETSYSNLSASDAQSYIICEIVAATNIQRLYGSSGYSCTNGLPDSPLCSGVWSTNNKIGCTNSIVTSVVFSSWNIIGTLPTSIGLLNSLTQFLVDTNSFRGPLPTSIGSLTNLRIMDFGSNFFTGTVPSSLTLLTNINYFRINKNSFIGSFPTSVSNMKKLKDLRLSSNSFHGTLPSAVGQLSSLTYLTMFQNSLTGTIPSSVGLLTNLTTLWLYSNGFTGTIPTTLGRMSSVQSLYLYSNQLIGNIPSSIGNLLNLIILRLSRNKLTGSIPSTIGKITNLYELTLKTNDLSGSIPTSIGNLIKLVYLYFSSNKLSGQIPTTIGYLSSLVVLSIEYNKISKTIPNSLNSLTKIQQLYLGYNKLTGRISNSFGANGGNLLIFSLSYNSLTGVIPFNMRFLSSLESVALNNNKLSGAVQPVFFSSWVSLFSLQLQHNKFSRGIPVSLEELQGLNDLRLHNNYFTGRIPTYLGSLSSLDSLQLQSNRLTGTVPNNIAGTYLTLLDFSINKLYGTIPSELCDRSLSLISFNENKNLVCYASCLSSVPFLNYGYLSNCVESSVLCDFVAATNIQSIYSGWSCDSTGIPTSSICQGNWTGVVCSSTKNVIALNLGYLSLSGTLPSSLGQLSTLTLFNLTTNFLHGTIPSEISKMSSLVSAVFSYNQFTGTIPSSFSRLRSLTYLSLRNNHLTGIIPEAIAVESLLNLLLSNNKLSGTVPSSLCSIYLRKLTFSDMDTLSCYSSCLNTIAIKEYGSIVSCSQSSLLCDMMATTNAKDVLSGWSCNDSYPKSNVCSGKWEGVVCNMDTLSGVENILAFNLSFVSLTGSLPSSLGKLMTLTSLSVNDNALTGSIPNLSSLTKLVYFRLNGNQLMGSLSSTLCRLGGSVTTFSLSSNQLYGSIPTCISSLIGLTSLSLSKNSFSGTIPTTIGKLSKLIRLQLNSNHFNGSISTSMLGSSLAQLDVSNNYLTGTILSSFCTSTSLSSLVIYNNSGISCYDASCRLSLSTFAYGDITSCSVPTTSAIATLATKYIIIICILGFAALCCCGNVGIYYMYYLHRKRKEVKQRSDIKYVLIGEEIAEGYINNLGNCKLYRGLLTLKHQPQQQAATLVEVVVSSDLKLLQQEHQNLTVLSQKNKQVMVESYGIISGNKLIFSSGLSSFGSIGLVLEASRGTAETFLLNPSTLVVEDDKDEREKEEIEQMELHLKQALVANSVLEIVSTAQKAGILLYKLNLHQIKYYGNYQFKLSHIFHSTSRNASMSTMVPDIIPDPINQLAVAASIAEVMWDVGILLFEILTGKSFESAIKCLSSTNSNTTVNVNVNTNNLYHHLMSHVDIDEVIEVHCPGHKNYLRRQLLKKLLLANCLHDINADLILQLQQYLEPRGKQTIALFIDQDQDVPFEILFALLQEKQSYIDTVVQDNLYLVQYALMKRADPKLIDYLLIRYPTSSSFRYPADNKSLFQFAVDTNASDDYIRVLLPYFMPITKHGDSIPPEQHDFGWTTILHDDKYAPTVAAILGSYSAYIDILANSKDTMGRLALHIATPLCRREIEKVLYFLGIYNFNKGVAHQSATCTVRLAVDIRDDTRVALKFMKHKDQFEREISTRLKGNLSEEFVLGYLTTYDSDTDDEFREELLRKGYSDYHYCLVMPQAERALHDVIQHEHFAGKDWEKIRLLCLQLLKDVRHLHQRGLIHGDVKPLNVMRMGDSFVLIDLDACVSFKEGQFAGAKYSSAYLPPEMVIESDVNGTSIPIIRAFYHNVETSVEEPSEYPSAYSYSYSYSPLPAQPSYDIWALGVTLFQICAGKHLFFDVDYDDNVNTQTLLTISQWSDEFKASRLANVNDPLARNLLSQLLNKNSALRPSAERALAHPFFTGKKAARMPGEVPEYDIFISYRVAADAAHAERLYHLLSIKEVKVWWDKKCLEDGKPWEEGFCNGLAKSRAFVPLISREAINSATATSRQNFEYLTEDSLCDNVLLEYRLALELREMGLLEFIYPIMIGDNIEGIYSNYFSSGCYPKPKSITVKAVEEKVKIHLDRQGLGASLGCCTSVSDVLAEIKKNQGGFIEGDYHVAFDTVVNKITDMVAVHRPVLSSSSSTSKLKSTVRTLIRHQRVLKGAADAIEQYNQNITT